MNPFSDYKSSTDEVIETLAEITDYRKAAAEFFNNKITLVASTNYFYEKYNFTQEQINELTTKIHMAQFDALVAVWKEKTRYDAVRPFTAVKVLYGSQPIKGYSKELGQVVTDMPADEWESYIPASNHPEYPSATAAACGAMAEVLRIQFGTDETDGWKWPVPKASLVYDKNAPSKDMLLEYKTWTQFETECAMSRLWAGVHFKDAVVEGLKFGRLFAQSAHDRYNEQVNQLDKANVRS